MDNFSDLIDAVQSDLTIGDESSLLGLEVVKMAINRSYRKAAALFRWPELENALKTSSISGQEYYDFPDGWQPDSAWKLTVDGKDYADPLVFKDYLYEQENKNPSGQTKMWSVLGRQFFIDPAPTTNGNNNIVVWGQKAIAKLVDNSDVTIFSYSMPECNEAIVLEAVAILKAKTDEEAKGQFRSAEAKQILVVSWDKIRQNQMKYEKTQPLFEVPDFFGRNKARTKIGDF